MAVVPEGASRKTSGASAAGGEGKPFPWLEEALREIEDIRCGIEVDGPPPTSEALSGAVELLSTLARSVRGVPGVVDDPSEAVGVEFAGMGRDRVLFVIEKDGSASYNGFIGGESSWARFPGWRPMMENIGWQALWRAGLTERTDRRTIPEGMEDPAPGPRAGVWLDDALRELDDIRRGFEVDDPPPTEEALAAAKELLMRLAARLVSAPGVVEDPFQAIGLEFTGAKGDCVLFVLEKDGSASYLTVIGEETSRGHFANWRSMMDAVGWGGLFRAGVA